MGYESFICIRMGLGLGENLISTFGNTAHPNGQVPFFQNRLYLQKSSRTQKFSCTIISLNLFKVVYILSNFQNINFLLTENIFFWNDNSRISKKQSNNNFIFLLSPYLLLAWNTEVRSVSRLGLLLQTTADLTWGKLLLEFFSDFFFSLIYIGS